jgi:hypothetical protein
MKFTHCEEDIMNAPVAAAIVRRVTEELATSALPDAPVRIEPTDSDPRRAAGVSPLRRRSARLLAGVAGRLDPCLQLGTGGTSSAG